MFMVLPDTYEHRCLQTKVMGGGYILDDINKFLVNINKHLQ